MRIFIDAGHNYSGADIGASGCGYKEQNITFNIANELKKILINSGYDIKMSRNTITDNLGNSVSESINKRVKMANDWNADLFISIHCNASKDSKAKGTETLVYKKGNSATEYAEWIQTKIIDNLKTIDRGIKERTDLGVLRLTSMPALLIETAFITNPDDAKLLTQQVSEFAKAIAEGIEKVTGPQEKEEIKIGQTVMELPEDAYIQEIFPHDFKIIQCDSKKKDINKYKYFNLGYFAVLADNSTIPVGNLAINGEIIAQTKGQAKWINVADHKLTTIYTTKTGECGITKTDDLSTIKDLNNAISGIPIIVNGKKVEMEDIKSEGYFGNECYDTWHGFLGIRSGKLVYVAMKCSFNSMVWALVALGIYDAIKLDGGGSFILKDNEIVKATSENRRINTIGSWSL